LLRFAGELSDRTQLLGRRDLMSDLTPANVILEDGHTRAGFLRRAGLGGAALVGGGALLGGPGTAFAGLIRSRLPKPDCFVSQGSCPIAPLEGQTTRLMGWHVATGAPFRASIRSAAAAGSAAGRWSKQQDHNHGHHLTEALLDFLDHPADREDSEEGVAQPERQRCRAGTWAVQVSSRHQTGFCRATHRDPPAEDIRRRRARRRGATRPGLRGRRRTVMSASRRQHGSAPVLIGDAFRA